LNLHVIILAQQNIKSAEELEEEDREAQSAKLQELIRRGTPRDLAAAQELMKSLSGANPDTKPDYRAQALHELNKLEQKVILLNEMFDNADQSQGAQQFVSGDAYDVSAFSCLSAALGHTWYSHHSKWPLSLKPHVPRYKSGSVMPNPMIPCH